MNYKLSPSDLTFLYDGCKRCFYLKAKHGIAQPSIPIPSIFTKIAGLLKEYYDGKRTEELHPGLPPGVVKYGERFIESKKFVFENHRDTCYIKGRFDVVLEFDDGTYGVIDYKTSNPDSEYSKFYGRQLHSYAYALENPTPGSLLLAPISKMGLLYFHPTSVSQKDLRSLSFDSDIHLIEVEKKNEEYLKFIEDVLRLLESPHPPAHSPDCQWCEYLKRFK
ncbi:MAG: PD-(D/E)XK nuclease family protein [Candidatus Aminicenantales bacterium]